MSAPFLRPLHSLPQSLVRHRIHVLALHAGLFSFFAPLHIFLLVFGSIGGQGQTLKLLMTESLVAERRLATVSVPYRHFASSPTLLLSANLLPCIGIFAQFQHHQRPSLSRNKNGRCRSWSGRRWRAGQTCRVSARTWPRSCASSGPARHNPNSSNPSRLTAVLTAAMG